MTSRDESPSWQIHFCARAANGLAAHRGELADSHDLACGVIVKLAAAGDRSSRATLYETSALLKRPLRGGWLFGYAGPVVRWNRNFGWHPDAGVRIGFDALFWGLATPQAELADYCR